ncbi:muconolactone Delta-isomerase family protein [Streptomyces sp. NPDC090080]|uniref:muconolactone Delta-isomerase family protein n=1 Tax=Streptomyces sp. NPDC090080 TaxID=3365939 RepID=UPI00380FAFB3
MLFYVQMRWNIEGRISLDDVWALEVQEAKAVSDKVKIVSMYKVAGQRRVIAIGEWESADDLDRTFLGRLPLREYLDIEAIWPLRTFESFLEDCERSFEV